MAAGGVCRIRCDASAASFKREVAPTMRRDPLLVTLCVAVAMFFLAACDVAPETKMAGGTEQVRVTSPNGKLDAVLIREDGGGAAGGWEWYVYIVAKGSPGVAKNAHPIFNAGTLTDGTLSWSKEHLLEIHYNVAYINQFRNLWGLSEIQNVGTAGERDYLVEIRLVPASPDYSLLTSEGGFKPKN